MEEDLLEKAKLRAEIKDLILRHVWCYVVDADLESPREDGESKLPAETAMTIIAGIEDAKAPILAEAL